VGCFQYEPVKGAPANDIAGAVPPEVKEERWHRFMQTQQKVSARC
jgi:ribosomal protein S12 methylthiotransferase